MDPETLMGKSLGGNSNKSSTSDKCDKWPQLNTAALYNKVPQYEDHWFNVAMSLNT